MLLGSRDDQLYSVVESHCQEELIGVKTELQIFLHFFQQQQQQKKRCIYLRTKERTEVMRVKGRGRESLLRRLLVEWGAQVGASSHDPEITTRAETKSLTLN